MALNAKDSQEFVPIKEIKNGVIVLKDNSLRAVILVSSINLSLKSSEEQIAIINQFQSFLNTLDFQTQIIVQSRRLDIRPYLSVLEERLNSQTEELIKIQTKEYIDFIKKFTEDVNIMTKTFLITVPYSGKMFSGIEKMGILNNIIGKSNSTNSELESFEEKRSQLDQRVNIIMEGLNSLGLRSTELRTEELTELFYKTFNPGDISQGIRLQ